MFFNSIVAKAKHLFPLTCLLALLLVGGKHANITPAPAVPNDTSIASIDTIIVQPDTLVLSDSGATQQFQASARNEKGEEIQGIDFSWSSSDTTVATIDTMAVATGRNEGHTEIRARAEDVVGTARLTVRFRLVPGDPDDPVAQHIPDREFREPDSADFAEENGILISRRTGLLIFAEDVTVKEANDLLEELDAKITGGWPGAEVMLTRFPDRTLQEARNLARRLREDGRVASFALDAMGEEIERLPPGARRTTAWNWENEASGNWYLQRVRAPQMWNLKNVVDDSNQNVCSMVIEMLPGPDVGHPDLESVKFQGASSGRIRPFTEEDATREDHFTHTSGLAGATWDDGSGVESINPWIDNIYAKAGTSSSQQLSHFWSAINTPCIRAINTSFGRDAGSVSQSLSDQVTIEYNSDIVHKSLDNLAQIGALRPDLLWIESAGNDDGAPAKWDSFRAHAAIERGDPRFIVVEASDQEGKRASLSNKGGQVSAPGTCIRGPEADNWVNIDDRVNGKDGSRICPPSKTDSGQELLYGTGSGTSLAAPQVAALATALWALEPDLTRNEVRTLLTDPEYTAEIENGPPRIDAFAAAMGIDQLQNNNRLQRALVNVDDGTNDGNLRKKAFSDDPVPGEIHTGDGERGSGPIAMADLRVYRDAWVQLHGKKQHKLLDGPDHHFKKDLNMDGCVGGSPATNAVNFSCTAEKITFEESLYPRYDFNGNGEITKKGAQTKKKVPDEALKPFKADPDNDCTGLNSPEGCLRNIDVMAEVWGYGSEKWDGGPEKVFAEDVDENASGRCSPAPDGWSETGLLTDRNENGVIDYIQSFDLHGKVQGAQTLRQPEGLYHTSPTQKGLPEGAQSPFPGQAGKPFDPAGLVARSLEEDFVKCRGESDEPWEGVVTVPTSVSGGSPRTVDFLYQAQKKGQIGSKQVTDNRYLQVQATPKLGEDIAMDLSFNSVERLRSTKRGMKPFPMKKQLEIIWRDHPSPGLRVTGKDPAYWTSDQCLSVNTASHKDTEVHQKLQAEAKRVFVEENGPEDGTPDVLIRKWRELDEGKIRIIAPIGSTFESPECNGGDVKARLLGAWIGVGGSAGPRSLKISAADGAHTCRVTDTNQAFCWGNTLSGRLGHDKGARWQKVPAPVKGDLAFTQISSGRGYTCGITQEGKVYCWGSNHSGNLGVGEPGTYRTPTQIKGMNPDTEFVHISSSQARTCAVTKKGKGYCWGLRGGSLGNGTTENSSTPTSVAGDIEFAQIEAGEFMSCGLDTNGTVYCWGQNIAYDPDYAQENGKCVDNSPYHRCTPEFKTPQRVPNAPSFTQIDMAGQAICGITSGKHIQCWGATAPEIVGADKLRTLSPKPVGGDAEFSQVSVGYSPHACALSTKGTAYCWGKNEEGQLGLGETDREVIGEPTKIEDLRFRQISAGGTHTCGITTDGATYCWGSNYNGELGIGSTKSSSTPTRVKDMKEN